MELIPIHDVVRIKGGAALSLGKEYIISGYGVNGCGLSCTLYVDRGLAALVVCQSSLVSDL